jgi:hypothetical protein
LTPELTADAALPFSFTGGIMPKAKRTMYDVVREMGDKLENVILDANALNDEMSFLEAERPKAYAEACDRVCNILDEADLDSARRAGSRLLELAEKRKVTLKKMEAW